MASFLRNRPLIGHPFRLLVSTFKYIVALHLFWEYGYSLSPAQGSSMLPTIDMSDEWMLTSKRHRHGRGVQVGDMVVYKIPIFRDVDGMKRVLGMPGDYVLIDSPESGSDNMIQVSLLQQFKAGAGFMCSYVIAGRTGMDGCADDGGYDNRYRRATAGLWATTCLPRGTRGSLVLSRWP